VLTDLQKMGDGTAKITFGEGEGAKTYTARALTLSDMVAFEAEVCQLAEYERDPSKQLVGLRYLLWRSLRRDAPELTEEEAGDLFGMRDLPRIEELVQGFFPENAGAAVALE